MAEIARAFVAVRDAYGMTALNEAIDALDTKIAGALQLQLYGTVQNLLLDEIVWFLRNVDFAKGLAAVVDRFGKGISDLSAKLVNALTEAQQAELERRVAVWTDQGVPEDLAGRLARLPISASIPDIVLVSEQTKRKNVDAAMIYFSVAEQFRIGRLDELARGLPVVDYYDGLALDRARQTLAEAHRMITAQVLTLQKDTKTAVADWLARRQSDVERTARTVNAITEDGGLSVSKLAVAASLLADLARS